MFVGSNWVSFVLKAINKLNSQAIVIGLFVIREVINDNCLDYQEDKKRLDY